MCEAQNTTDTQTTQRVIAYRGVARAARLLVVAFV